MPPISCLYLNCIGNYANPEKINAGPDRYVVNQERRVAGLIDQVTEDINREITSYQNGIISRLAPYKIKERFRTLVEEWQSMM